MSEKGIEKAVVKWAEDHGIVCIKFTPKGDVGWPDHIFIVPPTGIHAWIEFKKPGERPTPIQDYRMQQIDDQGGVSAWTDTAESAIALLEKLLY